MASIVILLLLSAAGLTTIAHGPTSGSPQAPEVANRVGSRAASILDSSAAESRKQIEGLFHMTHRLSILLVTLVLIPLIEADATSRDAVTGVDFVADYFPTDNSNRYGIIVLNGSGGGTNDVMGDATK